MMFDWTINIGHIITLAGMLITGTAGYVIIVSRVDSLSRRMVTLEEQLKRMVDILIVQGRQDEKITAIDQRVSNQGIRLDELSKRFNEKVDKI